MKTNIDNIFAAGDVSEFNEKVYGLWGIAAQQGKIAGVNMCNQSLIFELPLPSTFLDVFGISVFSMGDLEECPEMDSLVEMQDDYNKYYKVFIRNNHIVGAIVLDDAKKFMSIKSLIENKTKINFVKGVHCSVDELIETIRTNKK